jgi:hypothetical protein
MSIAKHDEIDIMFRDDEGHGVLVIVDHLDWEEFDEDDHLVLLQAKINTYLTFVETGQLLKARPDWKGLPIVVQVDAMCEPNKKALIFYRSAGKTVAEAGVSLVLHVPDKDITMRF